MSWLGIIIGKRGINVYLPLDVIDMVPIPSNVVEAAVAVGAGIIVSLFNRCVLSNPLIAECVKHPCDDHDAESEGSMTSATSATVDVPCVHAL